MVILVMSKFAFRVGKQSLLKPINGFFYCWPIEGNSFTLAEVNLTGAGEFGSPSELTTKGRADGVKNHFVPLLFTYLALNTNGNIITFKTLLILCQLY